MYISKFVLGVATVVLLEVVLIIAYAIYSNMKNKDNGNTDNQ